MRMKRKAARPLAALLALVMMLTLAPTAMAAVTVKCPECGSTDGKRTEIRVATCATEGRYEYVCNNKSCSLYGVVQSINVGYDNYNHEAVYTDLGDGTHSGKCSHHGKNPVELKSEPHDFNSSGVCVKCGAADYSMVEMTLEKTMTIPVALNAEGAKLSVGDVKVVLGSADITADYELSYMWYNRQGSLVGNAAEYVLPDSVTGEEGTYYYSLYVMAVPLSTTSRPPVNRSCSVTVQVSELVTASATITTDDEMLYLGDEDYWSAYSVSAQIYDAVQNLCARGAEPDYVCFKTQPVTDVGKLENVTTTSMRYYFEGKNNLLDDVRFIPGKASGDFVVGFTVWDTDKESYDGLLTITVQQVVGDMDVVYTTAKDTPVTLDAADFEDFWYRTHPRGELESISFEETPRSTEGSLYCDYVSASLPGTRVTTRDVFYVDPGRNQQGIDEVTFLPGVKQADYITLNFSARGTRNNGNSANLNGTMYIFLGSGKVTDVTVKAAAAGTALDPEAFQKAFQSATGSTGASFYIQLLDVPESGELYVGRTATRTGTRLTQSTIEGRPFAYSASRGEAISSLTYVPGKAATESIRYVAGSAQGKPLYAGRIVFTTTGSSGTTADPSGAQVEYTCGSSGVSFRAASFENLTGSSGLKLVAVALTPPASTYGTLYYGRTATNPGVPITSDKTWFNVSTASATAAYSMNDISFVPAAGYTGPVDIPFTALNSAQTRSTGTVRINVEAGTATDPGTTNPGTTNPGTTDPGTSTRPAKTFPDVPATEWYYRYVTDLTTSGVLGGFEDGTFRPKEAVKLGQALKMIMMAAGYEDLSGTGSNWAKPFLDRAKADGLLPANADEDLNKNISRYTIAEIAARAMKLPIVPVTASPFADMTASVSSAPYVMALYNAKVVNGTQNKNGQDVFQGTYAITRSEFAAIIWRMQNYVRTGSADGTSTIG